MVDDLYSPEPPVTLAQGALAAGAPAGAAAADATGPDEAPVGEVPEPNVLAGLLSALVLALVVCTVGAVVTFKDHKEALPAHRARVVHPRPRATPRATSTPVLAQLLGTVVGYDGSTGALLVRSGGMQYSFALGPTTVYTQPCVQPRALRPGQSISIDVVGHSNGVSTAQQVAPASSTGCSVAPGTPATPSQGRARPDSDTLPPRPEGNAGAEADRPPHP